MSTLKSWRLYSASGKTSVAERIIADIDVDWVVLVSMDSFYKVPWIGFVWAVR